jgi:hypothetical protein
MTAETMCAMHYVPSCGICAREAARAAGAPATAETPLAPPSAIPAPSTPSVTGTAILPTPVPELTDPKARKALELAQAYENVSTIQSEVVRLTDMLTLAKEKLATAKNELIQIQHELMGIQMTATTAAAVKIGRASADSEAAL